MDKLIKEAEKYYDHLVYTESLEAADIVRCLVDKLKESETIERDRSKYCGKGLCEANAFKLKIRNLESRLKAADEVVEATDKYMKTNWINQRSESKAKRAVFNTLAKYKGEGDE